MSRRPGDVLLGGLPLADGILHENGQGRVVFNANHFTDSLKFLELVVLNERLIQVMSTPSVETSEHAREWLSVPKNVTFQEYRLFGKLNLVQAWTQELEASGVLKRATLSRRSISMECRELVAQARQWSPKIEGCFQSGLAEARRRGAPDEIVEDIAYWLVNGTIGRPLQLRAAATEFRIPLYESPWAAPAIADLDRAELTVRHGLLAAIKGSLDAGAHRLIEELEGIGGATPFPRTPIAWEIVSGSRNVDGMLKTALHLRSEYKKFRGAITEMEATLAEEAVPLRKKVRLLREIRGLASTLWPSEEGVLRKEVADTIDFTGIAATAGLEPSILGTGSVVSALLRAPLEIATKVVRRRRINVLLRSKKRFLSSRNHVEKLSELFDVPTELIRT